MSQITIYLFGCRNRLAKQDVLTFKYDVYNDERRQSDR